MESSRQHSVAQVSSNLLLALALALQVVTSADGSHPLHCSKWESNCQKYREHCQTWSSCQQVSAHVHVGSATGPEATDSEPLKSGVYWVQHEHDGPFSITQAYCDTTTDGGGWTAVMRRVSNMTSFNKNWMEYEVGFGSLESNFWYGLKALNELTSTGTWELRVDLVHKNGSTRFAKYSYFRVEGKDSDYILHLREYNNNQSTVIDALKGFSGMKFSTADHGESKPCAESQGGGWWYSGDNCRGPGDVGPILTAKYGRQQTRWYSHDEGYISYSLYDIKIRRTDI